MNIRLPQPSLLLEKWAPRKLPLPASTLFQEEWFLKVQTLSTTDEMSSMLVVLVCFINQAASSSAGVALLTKIPFHALVARMVQIHICLLPV